MNYTGVYSLHTEFHMESPIEVNLKNYNHLILVNSKFTCS